MSNNLKKIIGFLFIMIFLISVVYPVGAAVNTDIEILTYSQSKDTVYEGDSFSLDLTFRNTLNDGITDMYMIVQQSQAFFTPGASPVYSIGNVASGGGSSYQIDLKYNGGGNSVVVKFQYNHNGVAKESEHTLFIDVGEVSQNNNEKPDYTKYKPQLTCDFGSQIPEINAGQYNKLIVKLSNDSQYSARDIISALSFDENLKNYITISEVRFDKTIDKIDINKSETVEYRFFLKSGIKEGTYPINLNLSMKNSYSSDVFSQTETVYIKVKNSYFPPDVKIVSLSTSSSEVSMNDLITLNLQIENEGNLSARDLKVTLAGLDTSAISLYNTTSTKEVPKLFGKENRSIAFPVMILKDVKTGNYSADVMISYKDENDNTYSTNNKAYFFIKANEEKLIPKLEVNNIKVPSNSIEAATDFYVSFNLANTGSMKAENIELYLNYDNGIIPKSQNKIRLEDLNVNGEKNFSFKLFASENIEAKYYPIEIIVKYEEKDSSKNYTNSYYSGVEIETVKAKARPVVIINNYRYSTDKVMAGEVFELFLEFLNTSKVSEVSNVKVTFSSPDSSFTPTESSNSFYINSIGKEEKIEKSIKLFPKPDLATKSYLLNVKIEYDGENEAQKAVVDGRSMYAEEEVVSIPIYQEPKLQINDLMFPEPIMMGMPISLTVDFYNMGRSNLHNLLIKAEGDFSGEDLSYFVGEFSQGSSDYYDARIIPNAEGEMKGSLIFSFEDDMGNQKEIKKEFVLNVMSGGFPGMKDGFIPGEFNNGETPVFNEEGNMIVKQGFGTRIGLFILLGLIPVILIIILVIVKRRRAKKLKELENE